MHSLLCFILILNFTSFLNTEAKTCGELFLTVNAVSNQLEFNWDFTIYCKKYPDTLTLFYNNSKLTTPKINLETLSITEKPKGYHLSEIQFGNPEFPGNWNENDENPILQSHCYPFWLQSMYKDEVIDTVCIKIEPTWMENFGKLRIGKMMIPGTHDTGAWTGNHINLIKKYTFTQELNIWGQLVSGIRYLDIRIGLYENLNPKEWINHAVVPCSKLKEELNHIANFLRKSPKEVVILHMYKFENPRNFTDEHHGVILDILQEILGEFALPRGNFGHLDGPTLEEIWTTNKSLIISYNHKNLVDRTPWLWYNLNHKWGNKQRAEDLLNFLGEVISDHHHPDTPFCAIIAVLTANLKYIITNLGKSLRHMADEVNPNLSVWLRKNNWTEYLNIIATDFFMGNDVVNIAIEANTKRLKRYCTKLNL